MRLVFQAPLRRQLAVGVCLIVTFTLTSVGALSVVSLRSLMNSVVDTQLSGSFSAFEHTYMKVLATKDSPNNPYGVGQMKPLTEFTGQAPGNVIALIHAGVVVDSAVFGNNEPRRASPDVVAAIESASRTTTEATTSELGNLGKYRLRAKQIGGANVLLSGVTLAWFSAALTNETMTVSALAAVGLLFTVLSTVLIVRIALRPLQRLAHAVEEVAQLPLGRGAVAITTRIGDGDTNPRNEIGRVGQTLNRLLDHLQDAFAERTATDQRMRQFITDASHELRTPLAAIQGYAELTRQDSASLPENTESCLTRIEWAAHRMSALVSDLLTLARLDEGYDLNRNAIDLGELAREAVSDAQVSAPQHHWLADIPSHAAHVLGDHEQLRRLVANLLTNALTHTPPDTTVIVQITVTEGTATLSVTDNGPGIESDQVPRLFERFYRVDKSRSRQSGSAGLGLAIVKSIAEAHGGTVDVQSCCGVTTFSVRLPLLTPPGIRATEPTNTVDASYARRHVGKPTL